jgi:hypothetical protein
MRGHGGGSLVSLRCRCMAFAHLMCSACAKPSLTRERPDLFCFCLRDRGGPRRRDPSFGANAIPGGVGVCAEPITSVPVLAAGIPLTRFSPPPPKTALTAAPIAIPSGSNTTPKNMCGSGVGTGMGDGGAGTRTICRSTPITMSPNLAAGNKEIPPCPRIRGNDDSNFTSSK